MARTAIAGTVISSKGDEMTRTILVAYASRYGSTREVAESIAATLRGRLLDVEVRPAGEVSDLEGYAGVVLGGAIYMGRWHRDARVFAKRFAGRLWELPVAVFALGPTDDVPEHRAGSEKQFRAALGKLPFEPVATRLFGGVVDPRKLHFPFNRMPAADVRDWDAVRVWALAVADRLQPAPAAVSF
jgi:menaquinone-dependent protoporphyrinogen oxidase